jgi:hypothetical protein
MLPAAIIEERPVSEAAEVWFVSTFCVRHAWMPIFDPDRFIETKRAAVAHLNGAGLAGTVHWHLTRGDSASDSFLDTPLITCSLQGADFDPSSVGGPPHPGIRFVRTTYTVGDHGYDFVTVMHRLERDEAILAAFEWYQERMSNAYAIWWDEASFGEPDTPMRRMDEALAVAFRTAGVATIADQRSAPGRMRWSRSYADAILVVLPSVTSDPSGFTDLFEKAGGKTAGSGNYQFGGLRWSMGFGSSVLVMADSLAGDGEEQDSIFHYCTDIYGRSTIAWSVFDDIAQEMKGVMKRSLGSAGHGEAENKRLRYLRQFCELMSIVTSPSQAANWETSANIYSDCWAAWRIDALERIANEGAGEIVQLLADEAEAARRRTSDRINRVAALISIAVFVGLVAQLIDYAFSSDPPSRAARLSMLLISAVALLIPLVWVIRRRPD